MNSLIDVRIEKRMTASKRRGIWSRRDFLTRMGWAGFGFVSLAALLGFIRSAFPRVLFQPASILKVGLPSDYALGEVSEKYKQDYRVWIVREDERNLCAIRQVYASWLHPALARNRRQI